MPYALSGLAVAFSTIFQQFCKCGAALQMYGPCYSLSNLEAKFFIHSGIKEQSKTESKISWRRLNIRLLGVLKLVYSAESCLQPTVSAICCLPWWPFIVVSMTQRWSEHFRDFFILWKHSVHTNLAWAESAVQLRGNLFVLVPESQGEDSRVTDVI